MRRSGVKEPDHLHRWLLCTRHYRPHDRTTHQRNEFPPPHLTTSLMLMGQDISS